MTRSLAVDAPDARAVLDGLPVLVVDPSGATRYASPAVAELSGRDGEPDGALERLVHPDDHPALAAAFVEVTDGRTPGARRTVRPRPAPDRRVEVTLVDRTDDPRVRGVVVSFADAARPRRLRVLLSVLADAAAGTAAADDRPDVARRVLTGPARRAPVELGYYLRGADDAALRPVPGGEEAPDPDPDPAVPRAVGRAVRTGEATPVDAEAFPLSALPATDAAGGVAMPLGDHGALVASASRRRAVDEGLFGFLSALARITGLALDRLDGARRLRRSEAALADCRDRLERLSGAVETVRGVERRVVRAETAGEVERVACEGLAAADPVALAWVGEVDHDAGEVVPRARAGEGGAYLDRIDVGLGGDGEEPAARAARTGDPASVDDLTTGLLATRWHREAQACGFRSALAIPVGENGTTRRVMAVYGREAGALDDPVRSALTHLGPLVGHALAAAELRATVLANARVELRVRIPGTAVPGGRLAAALGRPLELRSAAPRGDGSTRLVVSVDASPEAVREAASGLAGVGSAAHLGDRDDGTLFEVVVTGTDVAGTLADVGGVVTGATVAPDGVEATVTLEEGTDVRGFVEAVRDVHPGTELLARRTVDRPDDAGEAFHAAVDERLTARQREVLQAAYYGGYFEWPRDRTGAELSSTLDIAQSTFGRHLRTAERKLLSLLFEEGPFD